MNNKKKLLLPIPHIIVILLTVLYLVGLGAAFNNKDLKLNAKIESMSSEEKLEYVLALDEDEYYDVITHIDRDNARELTDLKLAHEILIQQEEDSFTAR